jgi:hypothetical protein
MGVLGTISGTMLAPGVSRNGRLYTKEIIGKAVERMRARLADADAEPVVMRSHHGAGDDSTRIVGHITAIKQVGDGSAKYEAQLYSSQAGKDIAALLGDKKTSGPLRNTSIYGWWLGPTRQVDHDGEPVETGDDLEINALDFTHFPGVPASRLDSVNLTASEAAESRVLISEAVDATVALVVEEVDVTADEANKKPYGNVTYADPGYQKDKQKRYPLDTKSRAKAAWSYINQADNAKLYTSTQLKRIKARIVKALKGFGVQVSKETATMTDPAARTLAAESTFEPVQECCYDDGRAGFSISANNGPIHISIYAYDGIESGELEVIAKAAMDAACQALKAMDPDMDADIDVPGAPGADTDGDMGEAPNDNDMESAAPTVDQIAEAVAAKLRADQKTAEATMPAAQPATETSPPAQAEETTTTETTPEETAVSESDKAAEAVATSETTDQPAEQPTANTPVVTFTPDQFQQLLAAVGKPAAPAADTSATSTETAPAPGASDTTEQAITAESTTKADASETVNLAQEVATTAREAVKDAMSGIKDDLRDELRRDFGLPPRRGYRTTESADSKEPTPEELWKNRSDVWANLGIGQQAPIPVAPSDQQ